ncbi:hypothetical protein Q8A73_010401 [Channa argus]|nr:hypothetical protein Q8A73_010401 [Channa argus]
MFSHSSIHLHLPPSTFLPADIFASFFKRRSLNEWNLSLSRAACLLRSRSIFSLLRFPSPQAVHPNALLAWSTLLSLLLGLFLFRSLGHLMLGLRLDGAGPVPAPAPGLFNTSPALALFLSTKGSRPPLALVLFHFLSVSGSTLPPAMALSLFLLSLLGIDSHEVLGKVFKLCADQLSEVFTSIFNLSLAQAVIPY